MNLVSVGCAVSVRNCPGYDYEFCPTADERFICPVCMLVMRRAVQTTCGHRFCDTCIRHWLRQAYQFLLIKAYLFQ